jgi:nucleoside-diphosphate-sugar epimerase
MTVLVTGATGFVGGALVESLLAQGTRDLRVVARKGARRERLDAAVSRHPEARVQRIDANLIAPADAARAVEGVDVIYHLAASMRGAPADMFLNTVVASQYLLDGLRGRKARIVLVSSFSVYGVAELPRGALVDESTPLEAHPQRRDPYAYVKLRQERLFRDHAARHPLELVVVRPGVIYGPGGSPFSSRVGLNMFGLFLGLGGRNILPLTYVDNCADAIVAAGRAPRAAGETYNVVDDDLPTCDAYLQAYKKQVRPMRSVPVPYPVLALLSRGLERYHAWSHGQLPAIFTPYKSASTWGGNRFDNSKLKAVGWRPRIATEEGMRRTFAWLREQTPAGH